MLGMLYYYQVPKMARQKTKAAGLKALLASFRQAGCPFCTSHLDACNCGDMPHIQHPILPDRSRDPPPALSPVHTIRRQDVAEGKEEGITGRELERSSP